MILLDTHALIWKQAQPEKLSRAATRAISDSNQIVVSAISCWEIELLVARGRLSFDRGVDAWMGQALAEVVVTQVTCAIARQAGSASGDGLSDDPADRLIVATAQSLGAPLVTADRNLRAHAPVTTIW